MDRLQADSKTRVGGGGGCACESSLAGYIEGLNFGQSEQPQLGCISFSLIEVGIICYYLEITQQALVVPLTAFGKATNSGSPYGHELFGSYTLI